MKHALKSSLKAVLGVSVLVTGTSLGALATATTAQAADKVSWNVSLWGKRRAFTEGVEALVA